MNNPILNSEHFDRAAYALTRALDNFNRSGSLEEFVAKFERAVDKLARIMGMQAANDERKADGLSLAYDESSFNNI